MRRPTTAAVAALCSLALVFAGCGDDDSSSDGAAGSTDAPATSAAADGSTSSTAATGAAEVDCDAYLTVSGLLDGVEDIATGSSDGQVAADEALAGALADLAPAAAGDDELAEALDVLGEVSFQVTEDAGGPTGDEVDSALATIRDAWGDGCAAPAECPAPETLEAQGLECDAEGNLTPAEGDGAPDGDGPTECPSPEVLEAEGFSCDSEGNLTPLDEETVTECPAPEVLEAEGFTCDSEGNLTPIEGSDGDAPAEPDDAAPTECPAPETLEAQGLECDSEGNLTPIE